MNSIEYNLQSKDWEFIANSLNTTGYAVVKNILSAEQCQQLIVNYGDTSAYRKTVVMERYRFGLGEYKYFNYPLPDLITKIRQAAYPYLAKVANLWMDVLGTGIIYPLTHDELKRRCHKADQTKPTALILKYGPGGFNTLHQDLYGDIYFPMQAVLFLNEPGTDYTGGVFVLTEQIPRAQSRAIVLQPKRGDMLIFTTSFRPVKGTKGYYRVNMKHGVSTVNTGERYTLGIIFHDALS
ncbi:2OG-Fe(II) oxygenase [Mucilaginibacter sp. PAMB04168]|uniref:2OG-Fe(II) oxygenase n=1 Tax=Mucilaginibacter sp. PAMB04168 TaxID=3138567 RepID=UPI0031F67DB7